MPKKRIDVDNIISDCYKALSKNFLSIKYIFELMGGRKNREIKFIEELNNVEISRREVIKKQMPVYARIKNEKGYKRYGKKDVFFKFFLKDSTLTGKLREKIIKERSLLTSEKLKNLPALSDRFGFSYYDLLYVYNNDVDNKMKNELNKIARELTRINYLKKKLGVSLKFCQITNKYIIYSKTDEN